MPTSSRGRFDIHIGSAPDPDRRESGDNEAFRIALLGDFSGRSNRDPIARRRPVLVDRDNVDSVLNRSQAEITLSAGTLRVGSLDDFHPDRIYERLPLFERFREMRRKLSDPRTFRETAREVLGETPTPAPPRLGSGDLLEQMLGGSGTAAAAKPSRPANDLQDFIDQAMRPYLEAGQDPRAPELVRQVDAAAADLMRAVLHDRQFRAIESAWRSVDLLVRRLETGTTLKVYLIDVTKAELAAEAEAIYDSLLERSDEWALLVCNHAFGAGDGELLRRLGRIGRKANAPVLGEADPSLLGADEWDAFRRTPEAQWVGLALPRVLLRAPYGKDSEPIESFAFEEIKGEPIAGQMLFGNPAVFCALLLGQSFEVEGWQLRPGIVREVSGLPVYVYDDDGESRNFPCAEIELKESTAEDLLEQGIIPVAAVRNSDSVRVIRFQSAANPPTGLPGRWA